MPDATRTVQWNQAASFGRHGLRLHPDRGSPLRADRAERIIILKHRYHVGRHLAGQQVTVESADGLLHVTHLS